jgi:hypothetical protein
MPVFVRALWGAVLVAINVVWIAYFAMTGPAILRGVPPAYVFDQGAADRQGMLGLAVIVVSIGLAAFSALHLARRTELSEEKKLLWLIAIVAGAQPGMLAYWWLHVWPDRGAMRG